MMGGNPSSVFVSLRDGGSSWRLKALKCAQEQAEWLGSGGGSLGLLTEEENKMLMYNLNERATEKKEAEKNTAKHGAGDEPSKLVDNDGALCQAIAIFYPCRDNNAWDEIYNFKKCLIIMFAKQGKDVAFLETVTGLAQQHCLVEWLLLPQEIAKQAPLYLKKAIDNAEDEWSEHEAKKLIDTSMKGLQGSITKDFPYFHMEFGLRKGYAHVIDEDISNSKATLGLTS
ncbi:hypothetical protein LguiA_012448 [Lonicera macranthoides]